MGKGSNRAYKAVPIEGDETAFGDPPRNWGRVASMAGIWAVVLLAGAWMAPGFASGGDNGDTDARDQPPTDANGAALRYLRAGSNDDIEWAEDTLCDDASPSVSPGDLVDIRSGYEDELGTYPEIELSTGQPVFTPQGVNIATTITYISGNTTRQATFTVSVSDAENGYCVSDVVREDAESEEPDATPEELEPRPLAAEYLARILADRDALSASEQQCDDYTGITPQELLDAVADWEAEHGEAAIDQSTDEGQAVEDGVVIVPVEVALVVGFNSESYGFEVGIRENCVSSLEGGEGLLTNQ